MVVKFQLVLQLIWLLGLTKASAATVSPSLAKPGCEDTCGNISIPYPFGIGEGCYQNASFKISCNNQSFKPFLNTGNLEVLEISLKLGTVRVNSPVISNCNDSVELVTGMSIDLKGSPFSFSTASNRFTAMGCDNLALMTRNGDDLGGCVSICKSDSARESGCDGVRCCQTSVPASLQTFSVKMTRAGLNNDTGGCKYAFLVDQDWFISNLSDPFAVRSMRYVPVVLDWRTYIENWTCPSSSSENYNAYCNRTGYCSLNSSLKYGYGCSCGWGSQGNPYLLNGCQDVNECLKPDACSPGMICVNAKGGYGCHYMDTRRSSAMAIGLAIGIGVGLLFILLVSLWLYRIVKKKRNTKLKQKLLIKQNGGLLLQQQMSSEDEGSVEQTKIFTTRELEKATDNYNENRILELMEIKGPQ
ncbi:hypothetical protein HHK36_007828 [Tetracentron sinense]|uniref:Uncharacterized protein n=1 Tax=Tetracentron sinense TaxID=13715 RepID=A0A835DJF9_TETSI|nr:hypothetical protein HHK36_007828 [Tetracentron sinense]